MIVFLLYSSMALLSWNLNGYRFDFEDLQLLLVDHKPLFLCLHEIHILSEHHLHFRGYTCYWNDTDNDLHAHGGVAILVHDSVYLQEIALQSPLPVVAVRVTMTHLSFLFSVSSSCQPFSATDLFDLFSKFPTPFIFVGDFSTHNSIWCSSRICQRGALFEILLLANNLVLLNSGKPTFICMATGSTATSSIDLTLYSRSIASHLAWIIGSDLHRSDHFPVIIHISTPRSVLEHAPHWILARADWAKFRASIHLSDESFEDISSVTEHFTKCHFNNH